MTCHYRARTEKRLQREVVMVKRPLKMAKASISRVLGLKDLREEESRTQTFKVIRKNRKRYRKTLLSITDLFCI